MKTIFLSWVIGAIMTSFTLPLGSVSINPLVDNETESIFKTTKPTEAVDYYWFEIDGEYAPNGNIDPVDAVFLNYGPAPSGSTACGGQKHLCIGGFTSMQVNEPTPGNFVLNGNQQALDQTRLKN